MHATSYEKIKQFVEVYLCEFRSSPLEILDFGSQQVFESAPTFRPLFDAPLWRYRGLDISSGRNVDVAVAEPYDWREIPDDIVDVLVSGSVLEHVSYFWLSAFEIGRVLRPGGVAVLVAPSAGFEHRWPVDCWRFYRDGFSALAEYLGFEALEVFTDWGRGVWQDSILVMRKPIWDAVENERFLVRAWHQRAALDPNTPQPTSRAERPPAPPSPLASLVPGNLTVVLEAIRQHELSFPARSRRAAARLVGPLRKSAKRLAESVKP